MNKREVGKKIWLSCKKEEIISFVNKLDEAYIVGGFLRDIILGRETKDIDFIVKKGGINIAQLIKKEKKDVSFVVLDKERDIIRLIYKDRYYDFSPLGSQSIEENLKERDFTINAIAFSLKDKSIYDPYNGLRDIEEKRIELISEEALEKDAVRLLRALRFAAELNFKLSPFTQEKLKEKAYLLAEAPGERVQEELFLILKTNHASEFIEIGIKLNLILTLFPELKEIAEHSLTTLKNLELLLNGEKGSLISLFPEHHDKIKLYLKEEVCGGKEKESFIKLACLLHDIGKPLTYKEEDEKVHFIGHEHIGAALSNKIAARLRLPKKGRDFLYSLVRNHMWPGYLSVVEDLTERAISRFLRRCQNYSLALIILFLADRKATGLKWDTKTKERMRRIVDRYFYIPPVKVRLVSGYDIMEQYNLKPGPIIGRLLKLIEEAQEEGRVKTKEEALELIKPFVDAYHSSSSG